MMLVTLAAALLALPALALDYDGAGAPDRAGLAAYLAELTGRARALGARDPLWAGLPDRVPADFLDREGFIRFEELSDAEAAALRGGRGYSPAPIGGSTTFDGQPVRPSDGQRLREVFDPDNAYAAIPRGTRIRVGTDAQGRAVWEYPAGTTVAHLILLKTSPPRVYELRLARKRADGSWAFGSYSPADLTQEEPAPELVLSTYSGLPRAEFPVRLAGSPGRTVRVGIARINLASCRGCHLMNSPADYQYGSPREAGPCGFVPNNRHVAAWAAEYQRRFGEPAFE